MAATLNESGPHSQMAVGRRAVVHDLINTERAIEECCKESSNDNRGRDALAVSHTLPSRRAGDGPVAILGTGGEG
jgi:hypothetical protein